MVSIKNSTRIKEIEIKWKKPIFDLLYKLHWQDDLKHKEIAEKINIPRPTVTRWFHQFGIPTQPCARFTNFNLLNVGLRKTPPAKLKVKKEFPWKYNKEFFKKWSKEMAYVLGYAFADGA